MFVVFVVFVVFFVFVLLKELDVYNHNDNFSKASTLISEIKHMIRKTEHNYVTSSDIDTLNQNQEHHVQQLQEIQRAMENQPKSEPPVYIRLR